MRTSRQAALWLLGVSGVVASACAAPVVPTDDGDGESDDVGSDDGQSDTGDGDGDGDRPPLPEPAPPRIVFEEQVAGGGTRLLVADVSTSTPGKAVVVDEFEGFLELHRDGAVTGFYVVYWIYRPNLDRMDLRLADLRDLANPVVHTITDGLEFDDVDQYVLTPHEDQVLFFAESSEGPGLYVVYLDDGIPSAPQLIHGFPEQGGGDHLLVDGDGSHAVFVADPDQDGFDELIRLDLETHEPLVISRFEDRATWIDPIRFSPDDALVYFEANPIRSDFIELFLADVEGRGQRKINERPQSTIRYYDSTADSRRWVYTQSYDDDDVYLVTVDGHEPGDAQRVNDPHGADLSPVRFSPDGEGLTYTGAKDGNARLAWVDLSSGTPADPVLLHGPEWFYYQDDAQFSLDSKTVLFTAVSQFDYRRGLHRVDVTDPSSIEQISDPLHDVDDYLLSPGREYVVFRNYVDLWMADLDTTPAEPVEFPTESELLAQRTMHGFVSADLFCYYKRDELDDLHLWGVRVSDQDPTPYLLSTGFPVGQVLAVPDPYASANP